MSAHIETIITCDGTLPNRMPHMPQGNYCEGNDWSADSRTMTAAQQRADAKLRGWVHRGTKDYCPACWENEKSINKATL